MDDSSLKICMVAPLPPPYGGISHWASMIQDHAKTQVDLELQVVDIAPRWRAIHDRSTYKRVLGGALQTLRDAWSLARNIRISRPQLIHLTTSGQLAIFRDLIVMLLADLFSVPVVYHIRFGRVPEIAERATREWSLMRVALSRADKVIAIDRSTNDAIKKYLPCVHVLQVPNCVDFSRLPKVKKEKSKINKAVFIGWMLPTKGIEELVAAWSQLELMDWRLDIVGPGDQSYKDTLIGKYHPPQVNFLGELSHAEAMTVLSESDCFILPSYTEGFPNVVLEAMALGKPIIATSVGAIPEMLDGECGLVINPRSISELKDAIQSLAGDVNLRETMGLRAQEKARSKYSLDVVFEKYMNVWRQAAGRD